MYKSYVESILNKRMFDADKGSSGGDSGDSGDADKDSSEGDSGEEKTFTQGDVNNLISKTKLDQKNKNAEAIKEAVAVAQAEWKAEQDKASEFNKLNDKQKKEAIEQEREAKLAERENAVKLSEFKVEVKQDLQSKNLDPMFADMVIPADLNPEKTAENIANVKKLIDEGIKAGIETGLATYKAKDTGSGSGENDLGTRYGKHINNDQNTIPDGIWK